MKTKGITFIVLIVTLVSLRPQAQFSEIGLNTGYGSTSVDKYNMIFVLPFSSDSEYANYFRFGVCYYYTPENAIFTFKTGLDYDLKWKNGKRLNYVGTPLGLDFNFGNKVQFILGGGLFLRYLISFTGTSNNPDFESSYSRFQIGWFANTGIGVQVSKQYNLSIKYQYSADITKMYEDKRTSPGGLPYGLEAKSYDGFIILCLKSLLF